MWILVQEASFCATSLYSFYDMCVCICVYKYRFSFTGQPYRRNIATNKKPLNYGFLFYLFCRNLNTRRISIMLQQVHQLTTQLTSNRRKQSCCAQTGVRSHALTAQLIILHHWATADFPLTRPTIPYWIASIIVGRQDAKVNNYPTM